MKTGKLYKYKHTNGIRGTVLFLFAIDSGAGGILIRPPWISSGDIFMFLSEGEIRNKVLYKGKVGFVSKFAVVEEMQ